MLKKFASEALGLSDIGAIIEPKDYGSVDADDYLFHEDGEKIVFLIKSRKDEYCFTNIALIHIDGESAVSSKRAIRRYEYTSHRIENVGIETAGTIDLDIELKFSIGGVAFSIDVRKKHLEQLKDIYKALVTIGRRQQLDHACRENALRVLEATASMYKIGAMPSEQAVIGLYDALLKNVNRTLFVEHTRRDFEDVFSRYIQN